MDIRLIGQVGNWLFHTAAAVKEFGRDSLTVAMCSAKREEFARSHEVFKSLCDWLPVRRARRSECSPDAIRRAALSNWQSLKCIPPREECRNLFKVARRTDVAYPVIHIRGTDYFTFFKDRNVVAGADGIRACAGALGFKVGECLIVTDDPAYVRSLDLNPKGIVSGTAVDDFSVLANARYLAMAPSTFSWWAGFIGYHDKVVMPVGVGPWDAGLLDGDPFSAHCNAELCWGEECATAKCGFSDDVALVTICTGRYIDLFKGFYDTFKAHVKGSVRLYAMTDRPDLVREVSGGDAVPICIGHEKWPGVVLHKHAHFLDAGPVLSGHRAIMSVQVNARFVKDVEFSALIGDRMLFCLHPYNKPGSRYICGGVLGGPFNRFMETSRAVDGYLKCELAAGRTPKWHDETALNAYKDSCNGDYDVLQSDFGYAEERAGMRTDNSVLMFRDKDRFFGCKKSEYAS